MRISDWSSDVCSSDLSIADSSIVSTVKGAVATVVDGVGIERAHGYAKIKVGGPTVGLRGKGFEASGSVSWSGGFAVETAYRGLHFSGSLERSEEHTSELPSLMRISYAVFCLKKKK